MFLFYPCCFLFRQCYYLLIVSEKSREDLLRICVADVALADDVKLADIADQLDGYSGADVTNVARLFALIVGEK